MVELDITQGDLLHCPPILPPGLLLDIQVLANPTPLQKLTLLRRHEGRKMKQELRCHAVLCPKEEKARQMATCLQERLHQVRSSTNLDSDSDSSS